MKEFWNERYSEKEYAYGKMPNRFFKEKLKKLEPGRLLLPAEGEGRNAVYAALHDWDVDAFDYSDQARSKAMKLARENRVHIHYDLYPAEAFEPVENRYDLIALIYVHLPEKVFKPLLKKLIKSLKPGGQLIIEGYSDKQLGRDSGGPKDLGLLYSPDVLKEYLKPLQIIQFEEKEITLSEGEFHKGEGVVIRAAAQKRK
jgi:SAM-dependent methyltransferase